MSENISRNKLKKFFIKLIAITFAIIIVINITYNLIFEEKLENINKVLSLNKNENRELVKEKLRSEIRKSLNKDHILNEEDKILLYKFYLKIKNEFKEIDKN